MASNNPIPRSFLAPSRVTGWSVVAVLLLALYWEVFIKWGTDLLNDPNYSHGLLIPFISLYLFKQRFGGLKATKSNPQNLGLLIILAALVIFVFGRAGGELFSQRFSFVLLLAGLVVYMEGKEMFRILFFPILLLLFAIPLPYILYNSVAFPLKLLATKIAALLINFSGMPVFRDGNIIHLPHTTLEVVDACSGIRSLMTLLTLAVLLASFIIRSMWKRALIIGLAVPVAVAANAGRVALTGLLTKSDPAWGSGTLHEITGWSVFVVSFGVLIGVSLLMDRRTNS